MIQFHTNLSYFYFAMFTGFYALDVGQESQHLFHLNHIHGYYEPSQSNHECIQRISFLWGPRRKSWPNVVESFVRFIEFGMAWRGHVQNGDDEAASAH